MGTVSLPAVVVAVLECYAKEAEGIGISEGH
jgi:hypothetical protein